MYCYAKLYFFFFTVFIFISAVSIAYYYGVVPTSVGLHSKYYISSSIAMEGYDLTIYHSQKKANKGDVRFNYKYDDTNWFFTNTRNQKLFAARPQKYIPKFGGYCTLMISKGYTYPPDMNVWHIDKKNNLYDDTVLVPSNMPRGEYDLKIGILDPLSNKPKVKLAISGKQPDGWYYLGKIKIRN